MRRCGIALGAWLVVALLIAACGSSSEHRAAGTAASEVTTSSSPAPALEDPADAYRRAVTAYDAAADPPNPDAAGLVDAYEGDALVKAQAALGRSRADGIASRGGRAVQSAAVSADDGDRATVVACVRDDQERYRLRDGAVLAPAPGTTASVVAELVRVDGRWKVSTLRPGDGC